MKANLILLLTFLGVISASAQTGAIIFPQLMSSTNTVLMTNAEFRCFNGAKIFFKNDAGYKSFTADELNTNVLNSLGTSAAKLESKQAEMDAADQRYKSSVIAWNAQRAQQQKLLAQQKTDAAAKAKANMDAAAKERAAHTVIIQQPRGSDLNDMQKLGAF